MAQTPVNSRFKSNEDHTCKVETMVIPSDHGEIIKTGFDYYQKRLQEKLVEYKKYL